MFVNLERLQDFSDKSRVGLHEHGMLTVQQFSISA